MRDKSQILRSCPLFQSLDARTIEKLTTLFEAKTLAPDQVLFREGDPSDAVYVIDEGQVAVWKGFENPQKPGKLLALIGAHASLGEAALFGARPRTASATAKETVSALRLGGDAFARFSQQDPASGHAVLRAASLILFDRLERTNQELSAIHDLGTFLTGGPTLEVLANEAAERMLQFVPQADRAIFYLWNQYTEEYDPLGFRSRQENPSAVTPLPKNHPMILRFQETRETVTGEENLGDKPLFVMAAPILHETRVLGCLALSRTEGAFGGAERNLLEAAASLLSGAVLAAWAAAENQAKERLVRSKGASAE